VKKGQEAELWIDATKLHFFDPEGGRNLSLAEDAGNGGASAA
jgi:hypothetical protein